VETPRKFITANLLCSNNLRGVSTNKTIISAISLLKIEQNGGFLEI
jgi:hypothetical protein